MAAAGVKPAGNTRVVEVPKVAGEAIKTGPKAVSECSVDSPLQACQAALDLIRAGGRLPEIAECTIRRIEGKMAVESRRCVSGLPYVWREAVNNAVEFYRGTGRKESELDGLRLALAQQVRKMIGDGENT